MKLFFKQILEVIVSLANGSADKNQMWLTYGSLVFGLIISFLLGSVSAILLMCIFTLIGELIYCFVPTTYVNWLNFWFRIPDFKEFKSDIENYMKFPRHEFKVQNFAYVLIGIFIFIVLKILFLFF